MKCAKCQTEMGSPPNADYYDLELSENDIREICPKCFQSLLESNKQWLAGDSSKLTLTDAKYKLESEHWEMKYKEILAEYKEVNGEEYQEKRAGDSQPVIYSEDCDGCRNFRPSSGCAPNSCWLNGKVKLGRYEGDTVCRFQVKEPDKNGIHMGKICNPLAFADAMFDATYKKRVGDPTESNYWKGEVKQNLDSIVKLEKKIETLEAQLKERECCGNCRYYDQRYKHCIKETWYGSEICRWEPRERKTDNKKQTKLEELFEKGLDYIISYYYEKQQNYHGGMFESNSQRVKHGVVFHIKITDKCECEKCERLRGEEDG